jgi:integrase
MGQRESRKTRYPGIYEVLGGSSTRYVVSYRIRGLGQRTKTLATLGAARAFQGSMRDPAKQQQARQLERGRVLLADYFPEWLERRRNLTPSTHLRYEGVGRNYITPSPLGHLRVSAITRDDVEDWISAMVREGVSAPTIDKAYRTLRACLETAVMEGKATANPAKRIQTPDADDREPFYLSAEQVDAVANAVPFRDRALVFFLAYTGARIGEATALRVRSLDLVRGVVTISENSPEVGGRKIESAKTKTKSVRSVTLPGQLIVELAQHLEAFVPREAGAHLDPNVYVFTGERGSQIRQNNWRSRVFQPACQRAGIIRVGRDGEPEVPRVHDLRHTAASLAAKSGFSLHEVKEMLGHSTITTTSDLYLHLFEDSKREKADQLGALMEGAQGDRGRVLQFATSDGEGAGQHA